MTFQLFYYTASDRNIQVHSQSLAFHVINYLQTLFELGFYMKSKNVATVN